MDATTARSIADRWRQVAGPAIDGGRFALVDALQRDLPEPDVWAVTAVDERPTVVAIERDGLYFVTVERAPAGQRPIVRARRVDVGAEVTVELAHQWRHDDPRADDVRTWIFSRAGELLLTVETVARHNVTGDPGTPVALTRLVETLAARAGWTVPPAGGS